VSTLLIGLLGVLTIASPSPAANPVTQTISLSAPNTPAPADTAESELKKLMEQDDAVQEEVDGWIRENDRFRTESAAIPDAELNRRIRKRFEPVRQGYEDLIKRFPTNASARVAFASYLKDLGDMDGEVSQLEKARELDPKDPAIWNNLANFYGEFGPVTNAFIDYEKAIELKPAEPVYWENFGDTVCMFRKDAREFYHLTEPEVFDKALVLYAKALKLAPDNFPMAVNLAQTYYIIRPTRLDDALRAWTNAMNIAHTDLEREGVHIHLARLKSGAGLFDEARTHLSVVTNSVYADLKAVSTRSIEQKEKAAKETNAPPAQAGPWSP
jgi:tetratricopeptide (TPR) repeat protein